MVGHVRADPPRLAEVTDRIGDQRSDHARFNRDGYLYDDIVTLAVTVTH